MKQSFKGIPKRYQQAVRAYIYVQASSGKKVSPATALRQLQAHWEQQNKTEAQKEQERIAKQEKSFRQIAVVNVQEGLNKLAWMRDLLGAMKNGTVNFDENGLMALLVPVTEAIGAEIEGAMYDLAVFEGKRPKAGSGDFI